MTWGWAVKGDNLGTPAESAVKASWPDYNAQYLKKKLAQKERRFDPGPLGDGQHDVERQVYLQETLKGYEGEAEACLKAEFEQWLQGTHKENAEAQAGRGYYFNKDSDGDGGPRRRHVYDGVVSTEMQDDPNFGTGWRATRWGTKQLTNLDGVRDFLRAGKVAQDNAERDMNLLAERGPQDLNEAWMYFKHWVKRRPVSTCDENGPPGSNFKALDYHQVQRMNGTGPSNWLSRDEVAGVGRPDVVPQPGYQGGVAPEAKEEAFQDDLPTATDTTYETFQLPSVRGTILETEDALRQADEALRDFNAAAASPLPTGQVQEAIRDLEEAAATPNPGSAEPAGSRNRESTFGPGGRSREGAESFTLEEQRERTEGISTGSFDGPPHEKSRGLRSPVNGDLREPDEFF